MKTLFKIENFYNGSNVLLKDNPLINAETGRKALDIYLKQNNIDVKVKVSSSSCVHFCVTPMIIENETLYINGSKRKLWYKIIN